MKKPDLDRVGAVLSVVLGSVIMELGVGLLAAAPSAAVVLLIYGACLLRDGVKRLERPPVIVRQQVIVSVPGPADDGERLLAEIEHAVGMAKNAGQKVAP